MKKLEKVKKQKGALKLLFLADAVIETFTDAPRFNSEFSTIVKQNAEIPSVKVDADVSLKNSTNEIQTPDTTTATNKDVYVPVKLDLYSVLISQFENEVFETGIVNESEKIFMEEYYSDNIGALNTLIKVFMDNFGKTGRQLNNLVGALHIISHISYQEVYPLGQAIAINAIGHSNNEIAEYGIKCFENWDNKDGIEKLSAIKFSSSWLQEYANDVIDELKNR